MRVYGLDFTSAPGPRKPLIAIGCAFDGDTLRPESAESMITFAAFEDFLRKPGPWVCGMDFPFGQPRSLVEALGWPAGWEDYVGVVARIGKQAFEDAIRSDMATRPHGSKWRYRAADRRSGSSSAMMLFRVPVGKMFFQGAPRLLRSEVSVVPCRPGRSGRHRSVSGGGRPRLHRPRELQARRRAGYTREMRRPQTSRRRSRIPGVTNEIRLRYCA